MTLEKFRHDNKSPIRKALNAAIEKADLIHETENELIQILKRIDEERWYVYVGYKSLMGFCDHPLRFSRTQALRIVTQVRRHQLKNTLCANGKLQEKDSNEN